MSWAATIIRVLVDQRRSQRSKRASRFSPKSDMAKYLWFRVCEKSQTCRSQTDESTTKLTGEKINPHCWKSQRSLKKLSVDVVLVPKLRIPHFLGLDLDGNPLSGPRVVGRVDLTEGATPNMTVKLIARLRASGDAGRRDRHPWAGRGSASRGHHSGGGAVGVRMRRGRAGWKLGCWCHDYHGLVGPGQAGCSRHSGHAGVGLPVHGSDGGGGGVGADGRRRHRGVFTRKFCDK
jgi:hypothetical protein